MSKNQTPSTIIPIPLKEVGISDYTENLDKEIEFIKKLEYLNTDTLFNIISKDKFVLNRKELKNIYKFCQSQLQYYIENVLNSDTSIKITSSWVTVNKKGVNHSYTKNKSIVNGFFSFNYHNKEDVQPIYFKITNCLNNGALYDIKIKNNELVLWDNEVEHNVPQYRNTENIYTLFFNTSYEADRDFSLLLHKSYNPLKN